MGLDLIGAGGLLADLARINIRYLLEHYEEGELKKAVALPLPPKSLSVIQEGPSVINHTISGGVIRELAAYKNRILTLSGSGGFDARQGNDREGAIIFNTGGFILREFRAFLEEYQELAEGDTLTVEGKQKHHLVFRAIEEDYHLKVEVSSFEFQRDSQGAHFAPDWVLTLKAYEDAKKVLAFQGTQAQIEAIRASINNVNDTLSLTSTLIDGSVGLANLILSPLDNLKQSVEAYQGISESLSSALGLPSDIVGRLEQTALTFRQANSRLLNDLERFPNSLSAKYKALRASLFGAEEIQAEAEALAVFSPPQGPQEDFNNPSLYLSRTPSILTQEEGRVTTNVYRLRLGEDLTILARRYLGDVDKWPDIAALNGWLDPFRLPNGRTAEVGDFVFLPDSSNTLVRNAGEDLKLNEEGALVLEGGDVQTIAGADNIEQAIKLRVKAVQNETPLFEDYGLPPALGRRLNSSFSGYLGSILQEQITKDPRIEKILFLELESVGDTIQANIEVRTNELNNVGVMAAL